MYSFKRFLTVVCILLLIMSIHSDLSKQSNIANDVIDNEQKDRSTHFTIVKIEVMPGDTLLSISEQLNPQLFSHLNVEELFADFVTLNPSSDPQKLITGKNYYFPKYHS